MVVDRSIHETEPGIYSVALRLPQPGLYDVPVFVDSPALSHCFEFTVQVNPSAEKGETRHVSSAADEQSSAQGRGNRRKYVSA